MKDKPELKPEQLYGYLPFKLMAEVGITGATQMRIVEITPEIIYDKYQHDIDYEGQNDYQMIIKPILHPLPDLTKPIQHNGEKFVPDQILQKYVDANNGLLKYKKQDVYDLNSCEYWIVEKLFEWKFDIHGLINAGLAIDVNELSSNPYK